MIATFPPGDPSRSPSAPGNPNPTCVTAPRPTPVMVGCPAEIFIRNPGPALVGISPVSITVGSPVAI
jgi:hypothetical protein